MIVRVASAVLVFALMGCAPATPDPRVDALLQKDAAHATLVELFIATDEKAWERVRAVFADEVRFDMTSLVGGEPVVLTPAQITEGWSEGLGPVKDVHHQVGNFVIDVTDSGANATCYGIAIHHRPGEEKEITTFVGTYDFELARVADGRFEISLIRFNSKFVR